MRHSGKIEWLLLHLEKYMVVISSVQLRGHLMGHPVYVIDGVSCLSFDSYKACQKLDTKVYHYGGKSL